MDRELIDSVSKDSTDSQENQNRLLKDKLKKIEASLASDKNFVNLKKEYNDCIFDCKSIINLLEIKFEKNKSLAGQNSLTMNSIENELFKELAEVETESCMLTDRDIKKIRGMLRYIYR